MANADSVFGQALVRALLALGRCVAVSMANTKRPSPFHADDQVFVVKPQSLRVDSLAAALNEVVEHFGSIDLVVHVPCETQTWQQDHWDDAYALADRVFWSPINGSSAVCHFASRDYLVFIPSQ